MSTFKTRVLQARLESLKPQSKRTILEFAMEERVLSPASSSVPGPWKPMVKASIAPMLAATQPGVRQITVMSSAQLMKTDLLLNTMAYFLAEYPTNIILAQPSEKQSEDFSRTRISGLIQDVAPLRDAITEADNQVFLKKFNNGSKLNVVSAAAPSDLASRSARIILMDEIDRYKNLHKEGDPEKLFEARSTTFFNSLVFAVSTPTDHSSSRIARRQSRRWRNRRISWE